MIVVQSVAEKEEGFVPAVIEFWNDYGAADRRIEVVIFKRRIGGELVEDLPAQPSFVDLAFLAGRVQFVRAALCRQVVGPASRMADFRGDTGGENLCFL